MNLAIKGHKTRGKEVIEILEMFGGKNLHNYSADSDSLYFFIDKITNKIDYSWVAYYEHENLLAFTLEEFLKIFPYKVGDKVYNIIHNKNQTITDLAWDSKENEVVYQTNNNEYVFVNYLQLYKEEIREYNIIDTVKESEGRYRIVLNHQFDMEVDEGEYYAVRRKPQYPKTYEECCEVLGYEPDEDEINCYQGQLIESFVKLLICRGAYWKIADEEMGLSKPWKPDWNNGDQERYRIIKLDDNGYKYAESTSFVFPTEEMRDAFFNNFTDLIEECKELL
jgi:hypothetical protein